MPPEHAQQGQQGVQFRAAVEHQRLDDVVDRRDHQGPEDRHRHGRRGAIFIEVEPEAGGYPYDRRADERDHRHEDGQNGQEENRTEPGQVEGDARQQALG